MKNKSGTWTKISIHFGVWFTLFVIPVLILDQSELTISALFHADLPLLEACIIFYLNYLFFIDKWIFKRRNYLAFVFVNVLLIAFFRIDMSLFNWLTGQVKDVRGDPDHSGNTFYSFGLIKSMFELIMPTVFALVIRIVESGRKFELEKKDIQNIQLQSELKNLKYQLQPHFFFNSLNNIYSLVDLSPKMAQQTIHNLSKLMQYLLHDTNNEKVDLFEEITFIKKYFQLMNIRQSDDVITNSRFDDITPKRYLIAPLLLIPIVENAYKHGASATSTSKIQFDMRMNDGKLTFTSINSNHPKDSADLSGSGVGLENLRKRLELIYPEKHKFTTAIKDELYYSTLIIELDKNTVL